MPIPKPGDVCLSIRSVKDDAPDSDPKSWVSARRIMAQVRPTRIEWSYVTDRQQIAAMKEGGCVFVAALNTIFPSGHAVDFEGNPCIAPWMRRFGTPEARKAYICMNNPEDLQTRIAQALELIRDGVTDTFQFDDWYGNAQMMHWPKSRYTPTACFCEHCMAAFAEYLGLDINYRDYLARRGIRSNARLFEMAGRGEVPLWDDWRRFAEESVRRYFRRLRQAMARFIGSEPTLSVNGTADFGRIDVIVGLVDYLNGETWDYSPQALRRLAELSRAKGLVQVVSIFPDVPESEYHSEAFVRRVNRTIALCYALGMLPLFPWDVYAGDNPRWFGTWEEYSRHYERVRACPEMLDEYSWTDFRYGDGAAVVLAERRDGKAGRLRHIVTDAGDWEVRRE
jgi:hypothetical protein